VDPSRYTHPQPTSDDRISHPQRRTTSRRSRSTTGSAQRRQVAVPGFPLASSVAFVLPLSPCLRLHVDHDFFVAVAALACLLHSTTHPSETQPNPSLAATPPASHPLPARPHRPRRPTCHCAACVPTPRPPHFPHLRRNFPRPITPATTLKPPPHTLTPLTHTPHHTTARARRPSNHHHSTASQPGTARTSRSQELVSTSPSEA